MKRNNYTPPHPSHKWLHRSPFDFLFFPVTSDRRAEDDSNGKVGFGVRTSFPRVINSACMAMRLDLDELDGRDGNDTRLPLSLSALGTCASITASVCTGALLTARLVQRPGCGLFSFI